MLFSFICGLRRLFVIPFPGGSESGLLEVNAAARPSRVPGSDPAAIESSTAFKKLRRETAGRIFSVIVVL
jgi:hypothetical protein